MTGTRIVLVLAVLALPAAAIAQGRPDCAAVIREMHPRHKGASALDSSKIAERLDTDSDWVERCAESYGRHIKSSKQPKEPDVETSLRERREEEEYEELSKEEKATEGDRYVTIIEDDGSNRKKIAETRDEDSVNEWEPFETHEWEPNLGHAWTGPVLHDDDEEPGVEGFRYSPAF